MEASVQTGSDAGMAICQLARLGDLAQTLPLIQRIPASHQVILICDKPTLPWAKMLPHVKQIMPLDTQKWRALSTGKIEFFSNNLAELRSELESAAPAPSGSNLTDHRLPLLRGLLMLNDLPVANALAVAVCGSHQQDWFTPQLVLVRSYIRLLATQHASNRIHVADLWASLIMASEARQSLLATASRAKLSPLQPSAAAQDFADSTLKAFCSAGRLSEAPFAMADCGIILGSGSPDRRLEPECFAAWFSALPEDIQPSLVLLGSHHERDLAQRFLRAMGGPASPPRRTGKYSPILDLVGRCSPEELGGILSRMDVVLGVDTGPLHWAAAFGTKTIGLYFAEAGLHDTGPYGDGHLVLAPDCHLYPCAPWKAKGCQYQCRSSFQNPKIMAGVLTAILRNDQSRLSQPIPGLRLLRSQLTPVGNEYRPLLDTAETDHLQPWTDSVRAILGLSDGDSFHPPLLKGGRGEFNGWPGQLDGRADHLLRQWQAEIAALPLPAGVPNELAISVKRNAASRLSCAVGFQPASKSKTQTCQLRQAFSEAET